MKKSDLIKCKNDKLSDDTKRLLSKHPDVVGIGYGPKEKQGELTDDPSVKLYVRKKQPDKKVLGDRVLPSKIGLSNTDVVEISPLRARDNFTQKIRPVLGGCSGAVDVPGLNYTGTLGMAVRGYGVYEGKFFVLSNNHVLANVNESMIGDAIIQPGTLDGGNPDGANPDNDIIGSLFDYVPLQFGDPNSADGQRPVNKVDAAIGEVKFGDISREIFWIGYPKGWLTIDSLENSVSEPLIQTDLFQI